MAPPAPPAPEAVGSDKLEQFLRTCIDSLASEATRRSLKNCTSIRPGQKIAEIQKKVWDELGVPVDAGRRAINAIPATSSSSPAAGPSGAADDGPLSPGAGAGSADGAAGEAVQRLHELRATFSDAVDAAYLRCLEDRRPKTLERKEKMQRLTVLEFLDACNVMMDSPQVRERLRTEVRALGALPERALNEVHGEAMELLGFEREHGQKCFADMGSSGQLANDREVATAVARWRGKASNICLSMLAEFDKEGGELHIDPEVNDKLIELKAKEELDSLSFDARSALLERNAKRVNVFRALPADARRRYVDKLNEQEKLELAQCEILMVTLLQARDRLSAQSAE